MNDSRRAGLRVALALSGLVLAVAGATSTVVMAIGSPQPPPPCKVTGTCPTGDDGGTGNGGVPSLSPRPPAP